MSTAVVHAHVHRIWSHARLATAVALGIWATLFWFVVVADRTSFYFASRTTWLAWVGAVLLTVAFLGRLLSSRVDHPEPLSGKRLRSTALLVAPAVLILAFPPATLGSYAVSRRSTGIKGTYVSTAGVDLSKPDLALTDIFGLMYSSKLNRLSARAGTSSSFTGFATLDPADDAGEFRLNRFLISCCPGDAVNVQLRIVGSTPGLVKEDDWVRVTGDIYPVGQQVVIDSSEIELVERPEHPYLNSR